MWKAWQMAWTSRFSAVMKLIMPYCLMVVGVDLKPKIGKRSRWLCDLVMRKWSEYRMTTATNMNEELKHITVLEEATISCDRHRARVPAVPHGGEIGWMFANAIAEMRVPAKADIADQSPKCGRYFRLFAIPIRKSLCVCLMKPTAV